MTGTNSHPDKRPRSSQRHPSQRPSGRPDAQRSGQQRSQNRRAASSGNAQRPAGQQHSGARPLQNAQARPRQNQPRTSVPRTFQAPPQSQGPQYNPPHRQGTHQNRSAFERQTGSHQVHPTYENQKAQARQAYRNAQTNGAVRNAAQQAVRRTRNGQPSAAARTAHPQARREGAAGRNVSTAQPRQQRVAQRTPAANTQRAAAPHPSRQAPRNAPRTSAQNHPRNASHPAPRGEARAAERNVRMRREPNWKARIIGVAALVALVAIGAWWFLFRTITVTVNGEEISCRTGSSITEVLDQNDDFGFSHGNLVSINGNVIEKGQGNPPAVTLNNASVEVTAYNGTKVGSNDALSVSNGTDVEEESTTEEAEIKPSITMKTGGAIQYISKKGKAGKKEVKRGVTSGETKDVKVLEKATDTVVESANADPKGGKYVALTFDDGPSEYTADILEVLNEKGAKATFFNLGINAEEYPDLAKAVVDGGHELASHTNQHAYLPDEDTEGLRDEISSAFERIEKASGVKTTMMRAPYGAFTEKEWERAGDLISTNVLWNIDTLDWEMPGAKAITNEVLDNAYNGAIILMHDGGGDRSQDIDALPDIIDGLQEDGYQLVTVSELMELDGSFPASALGKTEDEKSE